MSKKYRIDGGDWVVSLANGVVEIDDGRGGFTFPFERLGELIWKLDHIQARLPQYEVDKSKHPKLWTEEGNKALEERIEPLRSEFEDRA
jgi:hypothetical protein